MRPRLSLTDRLASLHQLLRASSFECWPLKVTFYAEDVFRVWKKWAAQQLEMLRPGIDVIMDESSKASTSTGSAENTTEPVATKGIHALDVSYNGLKQHLEKAKAHSSRASVHCSICHEPMPSEGAMTLVCPNDECDAIGHVECLAKSFLRGQSESLVPTDGDCPGCGKRVKWVDLVKELSLRMRGQKEIDKIFKTRKPRGTKKQDDVPAIAEAADESADEDDEIQDSWHYLSESSDAEMDDHKIRSDQGPAAKVATGDTAAFVKMSEPLVEDSDWDDAEFVA